jgi:penicillin amidase
VTPRPQAKIERRIRARCRSGRWWGLILVLSPLLCTCAALTPPRTTTADRLAAFPTSGLPLQRPVELRWNRYGVPWIEAQTDHDLAFTLGLVHAHLRLGQISLGRRIVQGRLSESAGPAMRDVDRLLRTIDFGYAAADTEARMSPSTHAWMQAFVDGLNWYQGHAAARPLEFGLLALEPEPWTIRDLLAIGRLAGTDVNWLKDTQLMAARMLPAWPQTWRRVLAAGTDSLSSFEAPGQHALLFDLFARSSRSGSDAVAIAPGHSASGAPLMAADTHLGTVLPNFWIVVGLKSPSYHAVGLMPPGLPIIGLGRNDDIAWSGTNMHAAQSELVDVSGAPAGSITERRERIQTRFWFDSEVTIRRASAGPIISDTSYFPARPGETIALRWVGHEASDEIGAFLGVMRARNATEFRQALAGYGVAGQNMLCATRTGDICQVMAVHLPIRAPTLPSDLVRRAEDPAAAWHGEADALALPWALNPAGGLLASANNRPTQTTVPVGYFFQPPERVERIYELLRAKEQLSVHDLAALQSDTLSLSSLALKNALVAVIRDAKVVDPLSDRLRALDAWDGRYEADQAAPVAFETLLYQLAKRLYTSPGRDGPGVAGDWDYLVHYMPQDLAARPEVERKAMIAAALEDAAAESARYRNWGDMHRLRVGYALQSVPVLGRWFVLEDVAVSGSRNTILKTAHGLVNERHYTTYGSQARQLCDLSDPDLNWFVLLGGQDGWLGSANFADQVELWGQGRAIQVPLTHAAVATQFPTRQTLMPAAPAGPVDPPR